MALFKKRSKKEDTTKKQDNSTVVVNDEKKQAKKTIQPKKDVSKNKADKDKKFINQAHKHLIRPIMTEQTSELGMYNQYAFEVHPDSNKSEIKKAIQALYQVKPIKVNITNVSGKGVRFGRTISRTKNWKKAIISLKQGDKIDVYEGV